jgi:uncharacterized protein YbjT (DUF2867 family)
MSRVAILGATGSLGRHVVQQAIAAKHEVAVIVRTPSRLPAEVLDKVSVHQCDLSTVSASGLTAMLTGHDASSTLPVWSPKARCLSTWSIVLSPVRRLWHPLIGWRAGFWRARAC